MTRFRSLTPARRAGVAGLLAVVLAGVLTSGYFVVSALAASGIPVPVITGSPSNPTTLSSASFTFTDSQAGVTFNCSLDSASFTACASGVSYGGLAEADHTFKVEAVSGSKTSSTASYSWAVVPPTPVFTSHPADPTTATTASFTYADSQPGVSFRCSLDGSGFSACPPGGENYGGLADGTHTFTVAARPGGGGPPSSPASYTWRVDTTPPAITVNFPANDGTYNAAGWLSGCAPASAGICGTAADPSGVSSVAVGIYQQSSKKYWNGSSFSSSSLVLSTASGTTAWRYAFTPPSDGEYIVYAGATDGLGNTTTAAHLATATFTYDTVPPPAPVITSGPANPSTDTSPEFRFIDKDWPNVTFTCWLDSGTHMACTGDTDGDGNEDIQGEWRFSNLALGRHCFYVYATDKAGNVGPTTKFCWTIGTGTQNFTVGGNLTSPLYPGTSQPLNLTFTNPNSSPITIARGGVSASNIAITSSIPGCASSNFAVAQGLTAAVTIPANQASPKSLAALGVPQANWPVIKMIDTNTNQDACQGATLTLTYSGIVATG